MPKGCLDSFRAKNVRDPDRGGGGNDSDLAERLRERLRDGGNAIDKEDVQRRSQNARDQEKHKAGRSGRSFSKEQSDEQETEDEGSKVKEKLV